MKKEKEGKLVHGSFDGCYWEVTRLTRQALECGLCTKFLVLILLLHLFTSNLEHIIISKYDRKICVETVEDQSCYGWSESTVDALSKRVY